MVMPLIRKTNRVAVAYRFGPRAQRAVIAAAAKMALADGHVEPAERFELLLFLRRNDILSVVGRQSASDRFTAEVSRQPGFAEPSLDEIVRPLAGTNAARLIAGAAASVAAADGTVDPREIELFTALTEALGLAGTPGLAGLQA
jgi:tellurite resistance protein